MIFNFLRGPQIRWAIGSDRIGDVFTVLMKQAHSLLDIGMFVEDGVAVISGHGHNQVGPGDHVVG